MNVSGSEHDSDDQLPRWFGDYVLLKRLGHGGMGQVFLARLPGLQGIDRLCVIKTLRTQWTNDREYVARFVDEARVVVQLNHRNICPVFDVGQHRQTYYLAMDLVPGRDLQAVLQRAQALRRIVPVDVALQLIAEVLDALDAAHRLAHLDDETPLNLVHRDVSPHNVLVSFDGEVKLIDFGLAHSTIKNERTEPGVVLGKMAYMAPEHARGEVVDRRADLFAAGVILYELIVGDRFWGGMSVQEIWHVVGVGGYVPQALDTVDADVREVVVTSIAAAAKDRYATAAHMRQAIVKVQIARGVVAGSTEVRSFMEFLFAGEALADRKERAALQKLPVPQLVEARESTRIAIAPSSPTTAAGVRPAEVSGDEAPTLSDRRGNAAAVSTESGPHKTGQSAELTAMMLSSPSPSSMPGSRVPRVRRAAPLVLLGLAVCVVALVAFVTSPPRVARVVAAVVEPAVVAVVVEAPIVAPPVVATPVTEPPVTEPPVIEPPVVPPPVVAPPIVDAAPPKQTKQTKQAKASLMPRVPLVVTPTRFMDVKAERLAESCLGLVSCAQRLVSANARWRSMADTELKEHTAAVDRCFEQCRLAQPAP